GGASGAGLRLRLALPRMCGCQCQRQCQCQCPRQCQCQRPCPRQCYSVLPTVLITDPDRTIIFADMTDNYCVRPEPSTFLAALDACT
ncbi:MAG: hypothetical protein WBB42_16315, partial [Polyangiales bacterium]